jgi:hypothetical protein
VFLPQLLHLPPLSLLFRPKRGVIENTDDVKENMNARERDAARLEAVQFEVSYSVEKF